MKTVHEFFTNKRMEGVRFVHSWSHSWMVVRGGAGRVAAPFAPLRGSATEENVRGGEAGVVVSLSNHRGVV